MGMVREAYRKGVPLLGVPENLIDLQIYMCFFLVSPGGPKISEPSTKTSLRQEITWNCIETTMWFQSIS